MRIKATDDREQLWDNLCKATNERARSKALDAAEEHGTLTAPEIAAILDERELPGEYETHSSVGKE
jgi:hypothetical protein